MGETSKSAGSPATFLEQVRKRISALSQSHDLLVDAEWRGASIGDLIKAQLKAFAAQDRLSVAGPLITLARMPCSISASLSTNWPPIRQSMEHCHVTADESKSTGIRRRQPTAPIPLA
ncbi:HWE histidine kinase domain-containing protein [Mesorhizobium sp. M1143]|uniref:HWE histidine kinase domain-containing protein n=1 Tax=Mesorhizobium sp. M1143 TaxID=2957061 RepID=UPI0033366BF0